MVGWLFTGYSHSAVDGCLLGGVYILRARVVASPVLLLLLLLLPQNRVGHQIPDYWVLYGGVLYEAHAKFLINQGPRPINPPLVHLV